MTNLRLKTAMWEDIDYCLFCGKQLEILRTPDGPLKRCGYHILVWKTEEDEKDELL